MIGQTKIYETFQMLMLEMDGSGGDIGRRAAGNAVRAVAVSHPLARPRARALPEQIGFRLLFRFDVL